MGAILWFGKMFAKVFAKLAILFAKFDALGVFDALAMLFGDGTEEPGTDAEESTTVIE